MIDTLAFQYFLLYCVCVIATMFYLRKGCDDEILKETLRVNVIHNDLINKHNEVINLHNDLVNDYTNLTKYYTLAYNYCEQEIYNGFKNKDDHFLFYTQVMYRDKTYMSMMMKIDKKTGKTKYHRELPKEYDLL